jgi:hypothetical protein
MCSRRGPPRDPRVPKVPRHRSLWCPKSLKPSGGSYTRVPHRKWILGMPLEHPMNTEFEAHGSDFPGFPEGPFVLVAGSSAIRARRGVLGAEVSGFASHLDVLPPSAVLERATIGCHTRAGRLRSQFCNSRRLSWNTCRGMGIPAIRKAI